MKIVWVVVLSLIALVIGGIGGLAWKGTTTSLAGFRVTCEMVAAAEKSGLMTKAQIDQTIDRMFKTMGEKGGSDKAEMDSFGKELRSGCKTFAAPAK